MSARPALELAIGFARGEDAGPIAAMSRDLIEQGLGWSWTRERVLRSLQQGDTNAVVARVDGPDGPDGVEDADAPFAGFAIMKYGDADAHLLLLAVAPALHRRGVGTALVGWLEACARAAGAERILLETRVTNGAARTFYGGLGFAVGDAVPGYYSGREASVRMEKALRGAGAGS